MKKYILFPLILFAGILPFVSCELETSDNGDLDGFWHLVRIDTLDTQGTCDMKQERIFWSFQKNLLHVDDKTGMNSSILLRFNHSSGSLTLSDPYIYDRGAGDIKLEDVSLLYPFGINSLTETFDVESLSSSRMTIASPVLRLSFKKM
ncbi:lipocalin-like domain-containing protein [Prevotella sp. PCHR]|uniref:Lipocalin-like domain-containing protein n=1 Tax=Xylanibacter caecicola TaxID=2736294 RepID=A0ABX2B0T1_9BACT|nr:lipocalin-like domain-containing protein [Xylanibacter caecicola]NPE24413.1 lipocalin-like domain-containing protein [Xylanibacter caecicola]